MNSSNQKNKQLPALLIVDLINSFTFKHGSILLEKSLHMIPKINYLRELFKNKKLPIVYVNDYYKIENPTPEKLIKYCINPLSYDLISHIKPSDEDYFIFKPNYSGFYLTKLEDLLNELKVTHLVIVGVAGNRCVLFTANDAFMRNYNLIIPQDAISSVTDYDESVTIYMMKDILNATIILSQEIEGVLDHLKDNKL
ncbi:cysteine hydrolase family protein [Bacillus sp. AFS017336]|uniref:cysteine hydrolase family protein n=1 Tax=Bacillus sp. AFS017336 TaxID=2033489 RepID=UPI000BF0CE3A|nr:isochorismatase family cysteine hydrolase [Bacillus sp. AFS017336]PEL06148.1 isochorismatase [Bacillus sp. AFS017336]